MSHSDKLANILSTILSPVAVAFVVTIIFSIIPPLNPERINPLLSMIIGTIFLCISPIALIIYYYRKGVVDLWLSDQKVRTPFYLIAILSYAIAAVLFFMIQYTSMFFFSLAYFFVTTSVMTANFFSKVSSHSAGVAGPMTALTYTFGSIALPSFLLVPIIIWARKKRGAHNLHQLFIGSVIAILVTIGVYLVFYP